MNEGEVMNVQELEELGMKWIFTRSEIVKDIKEVVYQSSGEDAKELEEALRTVENIMYKYKMLPF